MPKLRKEYILDLYRKHVNVYGRVLGEREFRGQTGISRTYWRRRYWKRWSELQVDAGFAPNQERMRIPDEVLLRHFADLALRLHRIPSNEDMFQRKQEDPSFPNPDTFARMAPRDELLLKLEAWCEGKPEFSEVAAMLERRRIGRLGRWRDADRVRGFVYLARRSKPEGMTYEIGREIGAGKQLQQVATRMRCSPGTIHVIDTDDPEGIERYWRARFRRRRQGRRYFRLFPEDILAFRWRQYQ